MPRVKSKFVLVGDDEMPASPQDVLKVVQAGGFKKASQAFGYSESHLRHFLKSNGVVSRREVVYEKRDQFPQEYPSTPAEAEAATSVG